MSATRAALDQLRDRMTSNDRLALLLAALALLVGYLRQLGVAVVDVLPAPAADTLTMVGTMLAAGAAVFAVAAWRDRPRRSRRHSPETGPTP